MEAKVKDWCGDAAAEWLSDTKEAVCALASTVGDVIARAAKLARGAETTDTTHARHVEGRLIDSSPHRLERLIESLGHTDVDGCAALIDRRSHRKKKERRSRNKVAVGRELCGNPNPTPPPFTGRTRTQHIPTRMHARTYTHHTTRPNANHTAHPPTHTRI